MSKYYANMDAVLLLPLPNNPYTKMSKIHWIQKGHYLHCPYPTSIILHKIGNLLPADKFTHTLHKRNTGAELEFMLLVLPNRNKWGPLGMFYLAKIISWIPEKYQLMVLSSASSYLPLPSDRWH